ncbi:C_GCAxxG_C_C family protein [Alkalidesulfovibrio alkalitolerans DSM 16529]|jgi:C_GCAxxG_C_C family probable redox protein|uniref:C_GCAxxG_C_C family protein n=1 Tax=Alkalidesulfovibrio alkalitolerans DSM 16529 TaxID=1121439 RepID=S7UGR6_9BACT|nr:C-GCAxxG-C-C family protein [Alkalidesulfovibrio alkalitolerans]EPR31433.1 C_GCAxxG_C_C family protein [Alkalidesulfovibrio alkalitolerans DSM 16529]
MNDVATRALSHWNAKWLCAESVSRALAEDLGLDAGCLPRAATAFCSGLSRSGGMCGALAGAVLAIGLATGRDSPEDSLEIPYALTQELLASFRESFGSDNCVELLGCHLGTPEGQKIFAERGLRDSHCARYIAFAAEKGRELIRDAVS